MSHAETARIIAGVPRVPAPAPCPDDVLLDGFLLRGDAATVRLVVGEVCLELCRDDILGVEERELGEGLRPALALRVQVRLRRGARLMGACAADVYAPLLFGERRPFAMATRPIPPVMADAPNYKRLERAYQEEHGAA